MGFLGKLRKALAGTGSAHDRQQRPAQAPVDPNAIWLYFRCKRCGTAFRVRVDRRNDLSREEEGPGALFLRKQVMDNKCFQLMEAEVWFDATFALVASEVRGGTLISEEEYRAAQTK
jgi:hypothetical protein